MCCDKRYPVGRTLLSPSREISNVGFISEAVINDSRFRSVRLPGKKVKVDPALVEKLSAGRCSGIYNGSL